MYERLQQRITALKAWQVLVILAVLGLAVFGGGMTNPFQNDDTFQIVINTPVHSIRNLPQLFSNSTFYDGQQLTGIYYRPMMSSTFALIYTIFGANTLPYHLVQLALYVTGAWLLYLILRRFIPAIAALLGSLIFLVHPINTQLVYSIPTMQDVLMFCFGLSALYLLMHSRSTRSLCAAAALLLLAMLSKEAGVVFLGIAAAYLTLFDWARLKTFVLITLAPFALYMLLRVHAVGLFHAQHASPIDEVSLGSRLLTLPSLITFYLGKLVFPLHLATARYWVYTSFSFSHVLLPLLIDLLVIGALLYIGYRVRRLLPKAAFRAYCFFAAWAALGIAPYLQLVALDMTACETWVYVAWAGLLGMIGIGLMTLRFTPTLRLGFVLLAVFVITIFGVRGALRATDYHSQFVLAQADLRIVPNQYSAMNNIAQYYVDKQDYHQAIDFAERSIAAYPNVSNYNNLGVAREQLSNYTGAADAYNHALRHNNLSVVYENLSLILMVYADQATTSRIFADGLKIYPNDFRLWVYKSLFDAATGAPEAAQHDMQQATAHGAVPPYIYQNIMQRQPFTVPILGKTLVVR